MGYLSFEAMAACSVLGHSIGLRNAAHERSLQPQKASLLKSGPCVGRFNSPSPRCGNREDFRVKYPLSLSLFNSKARYKRRCFVSGGRPDLDLPFSLLVLPVILALSFYCQTVCTFIQITLRGSQTSSDLADSENAAPHSSRSQLVQGVSDRH